MTYMVKNIELEKIVSPMFTQLGNTRKTAILSMDHILSGKMKLMELMYVDTGSVYQLEKA